MPASTSTRWRVCSTNASPGSCRFRVKRSNSSSPGTRHRTRHVPPTSSPNCRPGFDEVIAPGLAKNPDQRYPTARELAAAARQVLDDASDLGPCDTDRTPNGDTATPAEPRRPDATPDNSGTAEQPARSETATRPPSQGAPAWHRRNPWQLGGAAAALVIAVVGVGAIAGNPTAQTLSQAAGPSEPLRPAPVVLPFTGLNGPTPVAVGPGGAVYVGDYYNNRWRSWRPVRSPRPSCRSAGFTAPNPWRWTPLAPCMSPTSVARCSPYRSVRISVARCGPRRFASHIHCLQ